MSPDTTGKRLRGGSITRSTGQVRTQGGSQRSGILDLALGHPSEDLLPLDQLRLAATKRLSGSDASLLQYGDERGDPGFREGIIRTCYQGADYRNAQAEKLFVTSGASQALDLICTLYTSPGDRVFTAEPTYHLALRTFQDHGLEVIGLPSDEEGPILSALEAAAADRKPALFYLISPFANPSGATLGPERGQHLVELAEDLDFLLVADEVYRLLAFGGQAPASLEGRNVISLHSFSKILAPGLRLGWLSGPERVLQRIEDSGLLRSGGGLNPLVAAIVGEFLENERFPGHLEMLRSTLAERAEALARALATHLPQASFQMPQGGYFIWLRLPGVDARNLLSSANANGVNYQPGGRFTSRGELADNYRLSFAHYPPPQLRTAVERLARAVESEAHSEPEYRQTPPKKS